ncbi:MAG: hypothetical protein ACKPKO_14325, partial [Candidatus Fonsibacter sp.]
MEVTEERIDADPEIQPALEGLLTRIGDTWVHWADVEAHIDKHVGPKAQSCFVSDLASVSE